MMHFHTEDWTPLHRPPARGVLRLRYAAAISMVATIMLGAAGMLFRSTELLPFLMVAILCWVVFGTASRKNRYANPGKYRLSR